MKVALNSRVVALVLNQSLTWARMGCGASKTNRPDWTSHPTIPMVHSVITKLMAPALGENIRVANITSARKNITLSPRMPVEKSSLSANP